MHYFVEGEKIFIDETKRPLGKGSEGICYKRKNQVYKIYHKSSIYEFGHNKSVDHQYLIGIPTRQTILPNALIYNEDYSYAGYRANYIKGEKDITKKQGIALLSSSTFIKNLQILESDMSLLAHNYVLVADIQPVNYFFDKGNDTMYIIDPGRFTVKRFDYGNNEKEDKELIQECDTQNESQLESLITTLLYNDLVKYKPLNSKAKLQKLRDYIVKEKDTLTYSQYFNETLKEYENPNTYFKSLGKYIK